MEGPRAVRMGATCSFRVLHESQYADIDGGSMLGCLAALRSVHTAQAASVDGNGKALPIVRSASSAAQHRGCCPAASEKPRATPRCGEALPFACGPKLA
jgi:hypothetical protein